MRRRPAPFPSHRRLNDRAPALAAVLPAATVRPGCDRSSGLRSTLKWADLKLKQSGNGYQTATVQVCRGWGWVGEGEGRDGDAGWIIICWRKCTEHTWPAMHAPSLAAAVIYFSAVIHFCPPPPTPPAHRWSWRAMCLTCASGVCILWMPRATRSRSRRTGSAASWSAARGAAGTGSLMSWPRSDGRRPQQQQLLHTTMVSERLPIWVGRATRTQSAQVPACPVPKLPPCILPYQMVRPDKCSLPPLSPAVQIV